MERKKIIAVIVLLALLSAAFLWGRAPDPVQAGRFPADIRVLDLRGQELPKMGELLLLHKLRRLDLRDTALSREQYELLSRSLPNCWIQWSLPLEAGSVDADSRNVTLPRLTEGDLDWLRYMRHLETLEIREAVPHTQIPLLLQWMEKRPEVSVAYTLSLEGQEYPLDTQVLELHSADPVLVETALTVLPELKQLSFAGEDPGPRWVSRWMGRYPQVVYIWDFEVCGVPVNSLDRELILNDIPLKSVEQVESMLPYFYNLQRVEMCGCGIGSEEMDALWKRHEQIRFVWTVRVGACRLRTDAESFMPYRFGYDGYKKLHDSQTGELKYCVDMVCMDLGHMDISDYSFLAHMPRLKYLILADTPGTDFSALAELKELVFLEIFMTEFDQAEVLTGLTKLEDLNIGNSRVDNIEPLLEMTWLKRLWLPGTVLVSHEERRQLRSQLTDTVVMFACEGSTGQGWRESPNYYAMRDLLGMGYSPGW